MVSVDEKKQTAKEVIESFKNNLKESEDEYENAKEILNELEKYRDKFCCYSVGEKSYIWA